MKVLIKIKVILEIVNLEINQIDYYKNMDEMIYVNINIMELQIINQNIIFIKDFKGNLRQIEILNNLLRNIKEINNKIILKNQ